MSMPDKEEQSIKELLDNYAKNLEELRKDMEDFKTRVLNKLSVKDNLLGGKV